MNNAKVQSGIAIIPENETETVVELKHPVDIERAFIAPNGSISGYGGSSNYSTNWDARLSFIDGSHLLVKRAYPSAYEAEVAWQVVYWGEPENEQAPEPEIDWYKVPQGIEVNVKDSDNTEYERIGYFVMKGEGQSGEFFIVSSEKDVECGKMSVWRKCELLHEEDIEKYKKVNDNE